MITEEDRRRLAEVGNPDTDHGRFYQTQQILLPGLDIGRIDDTYLPSQHDLYGNPPTMLAYGNYTLMPGKQGCHSYEVLKKNFPGLETKYESQFGSVNVEFGLFCYDAHQVKTSISYQMSGVLVGAMFAGYVSDKYGRKMPLIVSLIGIALFSLWVANVSSLFMFTVARACGGFFTGGLTSVQGVFLIENIPKKHRLWINTVITWSPNFIIFPWIAYMCGDWRILSYFVAGVSFATALSLFILEESPRWTVSHGDIAGARKSLHRINKIDGVNDPEEREHLERMLANEKEMHEVRQKEAGSHQLVRLIKSKKYLLWTTAVCFGIVVASLLNYGLLFNMEKLSGSLYWNNVIFGILRWIINISAGLCDYFFDWFGRKMINSTAMIYIIPALGAIIAIFNGGPSVHAEYGWLSRYLTIGVTAMTSQLYLAKFIITTELFPTSVRNMIVSILSVCSRCATIFSPQLFYLADITPTLPYIVMGVAAIIDWIVFQTVFPETKGTNLINRIPDKKEKNLLSRKQSIVEA